MTVISTYFDFDDDNGAFSRLARVFEYSVRTNMPQSTLILHRQPSPPIGDVQKNRIANHRKLLWWVEQALEQTSPFILIDTDTVVLRDLTEVFARKDAPTDIAVCAHKTRIMNISDVEGKLRHKLLFSPFNAGVVFCNPTPATHTLLKAWVAADEKLLTDPELHQKYIPTYNGMNQASLGYLIEHPNEFDLDNEGPDLSFLPAELFNVSSIVEWAQFDPDSAYVLHIKGALRKAVFGATITNVPVEVKEGFIRCGQTFLEYEKEMETNQK